MRVIVTTMKVVAAISGIFLMVAVVGLAWGGLILLLQDAKETSLSRATAVSLVVGLVCALTGVLVVLTALGSWVILRGAFRARDVFGKTPHARLIALGLTALLLPQPLYQIAVTPVWMISEILTRMPRDVLAMPFIGDGSQNPMTVDDLVRAASMALQASSTSFGRILRSVIDWLRVADIAMALALWCVLGQMLSAAPATPGREEGSTRLGQFLRELSPLQRHRLVLGGVLLVSAYLSIAAMVAIPWLQQRGVATSPGTKEQLKAILERRVVADFDRDYPLDLVPAGKWSQQLDKTLTDVEGEVKQLRPDTSRQYVATRMAEVRGLQFRIDPLVEESVHDWENMRTQVRGEEQNSLNTAVNAFETETLSGMSVQERAAYVEALEQWFGARTQQLYGSLRRCRDFSRGWHSTLRAWADGQAADLQRDLTYARAQQAAATSEAKVARGPDPRPEPSASYTPVLIGASQLSSTCVTPTLDPTRPRPPDPGLGLGPFSVVSSWLVRTKSLALILITGMLGFGLLGASISSFVRRDAPTSEPTVGDLGIVVIRGLSAAVIVFLAVKGGLAAYATGESEPNAYVLFFTCLLGAAFSERVWNWARVKLEGQLPDKGERDSARETEDKQTLSGAEAKKDTAS